MENTEKIMTSNIDHPCFLQPDDPDTRIWRYLDFTKYVSLLESETLYLSRADLLGDPFEGSYTFADATMVPHLINIPGTPEERRKLFFQHAEPARKQTYINCWHANEHESMAMWKIYTKTEESIAIQSTYRKLRCSLPDSVYTGLVNYINYDLDSIPLGNVFWPFVHKMKAFEHEREIRAIEMVFPEYSSDGVLIPSEEKQGLKKSITVDYLIESVYISPTAPAWFADLVGKTTKAFGHNLSIQQSILSRSPVY